MVDLVSRQSLLAESAFVLLLAGYGLSIDGSAPPEDGHADLLGEAREALAAVLERWNRAGYIRGSVAEALGLLWDVADGEIYLFQRDVDVREVVHIRIAGLQREAGVGSRRLVLLLLKILQRTVDIRGPEDPLLSVRLPLAASLRADGLEILADGGLELPLRAPLLERLRATARKGRDDLAHRERVVGPPAQLLVPRRELDRL